MAVFKVKVTVMFRKSVLDPQGAAVERAVKGGNISFPEVSSVRVGKVVELTMTGSDAGNVEGKARLLADRVLANPVMEEYAVEVEPLS
ncbi:MAG: phosphoribosylformylglycinamidine synthase subunit PurS [Synergistaceae bacterium]|nr:phosphoribosylformylglycinamidine synthase subunit PurS [Synergistaceae bacterium]